MEAKLDQILKNQLTLLSAIDHKEPMNPAVRDEIRETEKLLKPLLPVGTQCQKCGEYGEDRRTLRMSCWYAMEETGLPFEVRNRKDIMGREYLLLVCKECRGSWMEAIKDWFNR